MRRIIGITGGGGFVGSHVIDEINARGHEALVLDRHKSRKRLAEYDLTLGDVRNKTDVFELAAHADAIIHLAAVLGTQETIADPWPACETNTLGMVNVLDACRTYNLPIVYAGVGNFQTLNTYSTTKTAAERLLGQYRDNFGLLAATVRPMNAYGPRQKVAPPFGPAKVRKITPAFVCRALCDMPIEIYGDGSQISDMIWVGDVARVFATTVLHLLDGKDVPSHAIEVGPPESVTVLDVADAVRQVVGTEVPLAFLPMRPGEMPPGGLSVSQLYDLKQRMISMGVDPSLAHQAVRPLSNVVNADVCSLAQVGIDAAGFRSLAYGMTKTVDWYRETMGTEWQRPDNG